MRWLAGLVVLVALLVVGRNGPADTQCWPVGCQVGTPTLLLTVTDTPPASKECIRPDAATNAGCGSSTTMIRVDRDMVVVSWGLANFSALGTTEACDVGLEIDSDGAGGEVDVFSLGAAALDAAGEFVTSNIMVNIDAGQLLQVSVDDPATEYCDTGSSCTCEAAGLGFNVWIRMLDR